MDFHKDVILKYVKENRDTATKWEKLMCLKLSCANIKYVFQHPIGYNSTFIIADFYIPKYGVIIEVDGMYHDEILQTHKDIERDRFLLKNKYHVIRMFNSEVDSFNTQSIKDYVSQRNDIVIGKGKDATVKKAKPKPKAKSKPKPKPKYNLTAKEKEMQKRRDSLGI